MASFAETSPRWFQHWTAAQRVVWFSAAVLGAWIVLAAPAYAVGGGAALAGSAIAAGLALAPGVLVLVLADRIVRMPQGGLVLAVIAPVVRSLVVVGGGLWLHYRVAEFTFANLLVWIAVFYFLTLALETSMILALMPV